MVGTVEAIHVAPAEGADPEPVERVEAVAGAGLRGDRYFDGGTFVAVRSTDEGVALAEPDGDAATDPS